VDKPFALIIEDERDIVALFRHVLDLAGYHTEIVLDGKAAMDYLSRATPDIVLLDLGLPGLSGSEILVRMNADERLKKIPVVVITAFAHVAEALPVTPQLILIKPVNIEQMSTLIQRICPTEQAVETLPWDVLTNAYNRSFFMARLGYALERSKQLRENKFAVLYLDLGQSTKINFLFGKEYQRRVLQESAAVLKTLVRSTDTIARLGGDVFVVLIEDVTNPEVPILVASRVQSRIRKYLEKSEDDRRSVSGSSAIGLKTTIRGSCRCTGPIAVPSQAAEAWMRTGPRRRPGPAASPPEPRKAPDSAISAMIMATISSASMSSSS
jgi:diguanylate cyclase (GGDEF)-like protein